jgi:hypothetical protein
VGVVHDCFQARKRAKRITADHVAGHFITRSERKREKAAGLRDGIGCLPRQKIDHVASGITVNPVHAVPVNGGWPLQVHLQERQQRIAGSALARQRASTSPESISRR